MYKITIGDEVFYTDEFNVDGNTIYISECLGNGTCRLINKDVHIESVNGEEYVMAWDIDVNNIFELFAAGRITKTENGFMSVLPHGTHLARGIKRKIMDDLSGRFYHIELARATSNHCVVPYAEIRNDDIYLGLYSIDKQKPVLMGAMWEITYDDAEGIKFGNLILDAVSNL